MQTENYILIYAHMRMFWWKTEHKGILI